MTGNFNIYAVVYDWDDKEIDRGLMCKTSDKDGAKNICATMNDLEDQIFELMGRHNYQEVNDNYTIYTVVEE